MQSKSASVLYQDTTRELTLSGVWTLLELKNHIASLHDVSFPQQGSITFNGCDISHIDTAGAFFILETAADLEKNGLTVQFASFSDDANSLMTLVKKNITTEAVTETPPLSSLAELGKTSFDALKGLMVYFSFVGELTYAALDIIFSPAGFRSREFFSIIKRAGFDALPIIGLLSLMIGVVLTYQMGLQLKNYGANIFIVDLLGLSVLREFAPLITAIMVAGRTGSAFTAQIGIMKINQEIDALHVMGVSANQLIMLPRLFGLLIALPLLTVWADIFGIFGGMLMSNNMLSIGFQDFLQRFSHVIPLRALLIGVGKTPVFAFIIASIGCFQGISVQENADSLGKKTTRSVVLSIFFIIIADAIFSIIFSEFKL